MPPLELPPDALPRGVRSVRSMPGHAGWQPARCCDASDDGLSGVEQPRCALMMRYDFGDVNTVLGGGTFGQVLLARDSLTRERVAVKVLGLDAPVMLASVLTECSIMLELAGHPSIVRVRDVFAIQPIGFALVMEICEGEEVFKRVVARGALPEREARAIMRQLLDALRFMHGKRIAHRDVKLENIMVADDASVSGGVRIKLLDFGFARRLAPSDACSDSGGSSGSTALFASPETVLRRMRGGGSLAPHSAAAAAAMGAQLAAATAASDGVARFAATVGSPTYMAPEVTPARAPLCGYGLEADLWSAGVCAFVMIAGQFPFAAPDEAALAALLAASPAVRMDARVWAAVSPQGRDLVARLLQPQPDERPTADAALRHAWFAPPPAPAPAPPAPPAPAASVQMDEDSETSLYWPPSPTTPPAMPPPAATGVRRRISRVLLGARASQSPPSDACGAAVQEEEQRLSRRSSGGVVTLLRAMRTRLSSCRLAEDAADAEAVTAAPAESPHTEDASSSSSAGDSPSCWRFGHAAIAPYSCITAADERDVRGRHGH